MKMRDRLTATLFVISLVAIAFLLAAWRHPLNPAGKFKKAPRTPGSKLDMP